MRILEYADLDTARVEAAYRKVRDAIARRDFRAAQVRKLSGTGHGRQQPQACIGMQQR